MVIRVLVFPLKGGRAVKSTYEIVQATNLEQAKMIINQKRGMIVLENVTTGECRSFLGEKEILSEDVPPPVITVPKEITGLYKEHKFSGRMRRNGTRNFPVET